MKKINYFLFLALFALGVAGCKKSNPGADVVPVNLTVKLAFDAANSIYGFTYAQAQVKITNLTTNQAFTATASADGTAAFNGISPGNYDISTTLSIAAADYNTAAGTNVQDAVVYNGTLSRQSVTANSQLSVTLTTGRVGDFVFKQIYYAGSNTANGAIYRDQFVEIYNNSNQVLYADSLYFAQIMGNATAAASTDLTKGYYTTTGQYDWSRSLNMAASNANTNYVYAKTMFMIPGTGKQYPVQPGQSIIIAATAQNHQAPYTGTDGKSVSVKDPSLTVDLSKADFEIYLGNYPGISPLASDVDNPAVPNLTVVTNIINRDLILDNLGRDGLVIFKSKTDPATWPKYATPDVTQITTSTNLYIQVPTSVLIDGVNLNQSVTASRVAHRIPDAIDAGDTFVPAGSYSSQSAVRHTSKTISGRIVLKDSNNSTNDFGYLSKADPSKSASSFIN